MKFADICDGMLFAVTCFLFLFVGSFVVFYGARLALKDVEPIQITIGDNIIKDSIFNATAEQPGLVVGGDE